MFAICLEASHEKGMGHLYRMLNLAEYLEMKKEPFVFLVNDNRQTAMILERQGRDYETVVLQETGWEQELIGRYGITHWINDRLDTSDVHAQAVKECGCCLVTFDDLGSGAKSSDLNICGLFFSRPELEGRKVLKGVDYLILNREIDACKRIRTHCGNILVTLGGSDTYGATVKVLKLLKRYGVKATIHIGPSFQHWAELENEMTGAYTLIREIPSLIQEFQKYDLAITGGGVTPFEANASGLPCLIIANEWFEIPNGEFLESIGSSKFLGYHEVIDETIFDSLYTLELEAMSRRGMSMITTKAVESIYSEMREACI